jgi:hypothetical protein
MASISASCWRAQPLAAAITAAQGRVVKGGAALQETAHQVVGSGVTGHFAHHQVLASAARDVHGQQGLDLVPNQKGSGAKFEFWPDLAGK